MATARPIIMMVTVARSAAIDEPVSERRRSVGRRLVALEDLLDILARLAVGRDASVALHGAGAGVVRGQGALEIAVVLADERVQVARATVEVRRGVQRILHPQL